MTLLQDLEAQILSVSKLNADGVPSASIALLDNGKISAHVITNGSENNDTVYQAASISKPITALAVARLVDAGTITYETKITDHLSESIIDCIVDAKTKHLVEHVTIGMLLAHTSGLSQHGFPGYPSHLPKVESMLSGAYPSNTPKVHFQTFPGAEYSYSGGGYTVLQVVLEHATKKPFSELMQKLVLKPLSMTRSFFGDLPAGETNYSKGHYTGYTPTEKAYHRYVELAAAGLWTTPTDLLKAVAALQESLYTTSGFLTQETARRMLTVVEKKSGRFMPSNSFGWEVNDCAFQHEGFNDPGFASYFFGFHGRSVNAENDASKWRDGGLARSGVAIMTNSQLGYETVHRIFRAVFYLKAWPGFKTLSDQFGDEDFVPYAAPEGIKIDAGWKEWIGQWEDWYLTDEDDAPAIAYKTFERMSLKPVAAPSNESKEGKRDVFLVVDGLPISVRLTWEAAERVIELIQQQTKVLRRTEADR